MQDESCTFPNCAAQRAADVAEIARLQQLVAEAIEDIADWAGYASEYFQDKHDLEGTLARYRAALQGQT